MIIWGRVQDGYLGLAASGRWRICGFRGTSSAGRQVNRLQLTGAHQPGIMRPGAEEGLDQPIWLPQGLSVTSSSCDYCFWPHGVDVATARGVDRSYYDGADGNRDSEIYIRKRGTGQRRHRGSHRRSYDCI